jgi:hypothetical protein
MATSHETSVPSTVETTAQAEATMQGGSTAEATPSPEHETTTTTTTAMRTSETTSEGVVVPPSHQRTKRPF